MPPRPARRVFLPKITCLRKGRRAEADRARRNPFSGIRHAGNRPSECTAGAKSGKERRTEADRARRGPFSGLRHAGNSLSKNEAGEKSEKCGAQVQARKASPPRKTHACLKKNVHLTFRARFFFPLRHFSAPTACRSRPAKGKARPDAFRQIPRQNAPPCGVSMIKINFSGIKFANEERI